MSVFTTLTLTEAQAFLRDYAIGEITALTGIAAGITNTNYFVKTVTHRYVLTIFEENKWLVQIGDGQRYRSFIFQPYLDLFK